MSWRLTYFENQNLVEGIAQLEGLSAGGLVKVGSLIKAPARIELRDELGQIVRMAPEAEFQLIESPLGIKPEYYGEIVILRKVNKCGKYRTSCWLVPVPSDESVDVYMKPGEIENTDEFYVFNGCLAITEYDENNRVYGICFVKQGEKVVLGFDPGQVGEKRYHVVSSSSITDAEYELYVEQYLDGRKWQ